MKTVLLALAASMTLGAVSVADAAPLRTRVQPLPSGLTADELRDYAEEQMERRHESERAALRMDQLAERRMIDPDAEVDD